MYNLMELRHAIFSEEYLEEFILQHYSFDSPIKIYLIRPAINDTYEIITDSAKYFLRISPAKRMFENKFEYYQREVVIMVYLRDNGINTPVVVRDKQGRSIIPIESLEGTRYCMITEEIIGFPFGDNQLSEDSMKMIGKTLGKMHRLLNENGIVERPKMDYDRIFTTNINAIVEYVGRDSTSGDQLLKKVPQLQAFYNEIFDENHARLKIPLIIMHDEYCFN